MDNPESKLPDLKLNSLKKVLLPCLLILLILTIVYTINWYYNSHANKKKNDNHNIFDHIKLKSKKSCPRKKIIKEIKKKEEREEKKKEKVLEKQVFNIGNNIYTYDDSRALCKALGSQLATYEQIKKAHDNGADWCNYGWSEGQLSLYPTQESSWKKLQCGNKKYKNDCGKPGINGGYFDNPNLKFGVNCYGHKPVIKENEKGLVGKPYSPDHISQEELLLQEKVKKYKEEVDDLTILPFNTQKWSK